MADHLGQLADLTNPLLLAEGQIRLRACSLFLVADGFASQVAARRIAGNALT